MLGHLTPAWIEALDDAARASDELAAATADVGLTVQQVVTGSDGDVAAWYLAIDHGRVSVVAGYAPSADLTFTQDRGTAEEIAAGSLSAQAAFMVGRLRVGGDLSALQAHHGLFAELGDVFAEVRAVTAPGGAAVDA